MVYKLMYLSFITVFMGSCKTDKPLSPMQSFLTAFPTTPVNMGASINSVYDDYNSTTPYQIKGTSVQFCFSSNRNSKGINFDIVYKTLTVGSTNKAELEVNGMDVTAAFPLGNALDTINTSNNQLGPYLLNGSLRAPFPVATLLYATDDAGNLNIRYINDVNNTPSAPQSVTYLNSAKDDAYPSVSKTNSCIYFCSNRDMDFDVYKVKLNTANSLLQNLADTASKTIIKDTVLSVAGYDDKCPYVIGNTMVFTSNRPGGYGGFDLYYTVYTNGKWSAPINFGSSINTSADEYRPIVMQVDGFTNNFMLFSSNRSGGMGGFDLYYVGITNRIDQNEPTE